MSLYMDYLLSSFGQTTAAGLSQMLGKAVSHDDVTRFLSGLESGCQALWQQIKPVVRQVKQDLVPGEQDCLLPDDCIIEKATPKRTGWSRCTTATARTGTKGIILVSAVLLLGGVSLPMGYELVIKTLHCQVKTREEAWRPERTKNEVSQTLYQSNSSRFQRISPAQPCVTSVNKWADSF